MPHLPPVVHRGMTRETSDTTNRKLDVSDVIDQLSPEDTPLLDIIGKDSLKTPCTQITHEWLEDQLRPNQGTLGAAYTSGSGTMTVAAGQGKYLVPDDIILAGNIGFRVDSGPPDDDVLIVTVIRGTDANITNGSAWYKVGHAAAEGGNARTDASKTVVGKPFNYTQIYKDWAMVTGTMEVIDRYGYASERAYQEEKVLRQLAIQLERNLLYGVRSITTGDHTTPRRSSMGGLFEFLYIQGTEPATDWDTIYNANSEAITEEILNHVLQQIWEEGGQPDCILCNGFNKRRLTSFATPRIRTAQSERTAGGTIDVYESDFGDLQIIKDRWVRPADIFIITKDEIGLGPLVGRQFSSRELPSLGDYTWYEILGEYTMEVHKPSKCHGLIYNTATA